MKICQDFITNSSSTSYIIAYKDSDTNKLYNKLIEMLINATDSYGDTKEAKLALTVQDLDNIYLYNDKIEKSCISYLNENYNIISKDIGHGDENTEGLVDILNTSGEAFHVISKIE